MDIDVEELVDEARGLIEKHLSRPSANEVLGHLGLQRKRGMSDTILPAIGIFSAGLAAGAVLGLLFAPSSGTKTRRDIRGYVPLGKSDDRDPNASTDDLREARKQKSAETGE